MLAIGFDTGGSRTTYSIDRGQGPHPQAGNEAGVSLADARGEASTTAAIRWMVDVIGAQEDDEIAVWIGAAGFSASTAVSLRERFREPMRALAEQLDGRQCEVFIANDAVSILKSPPLSGLGVAAIVGTGSVVLGAHPKAASGVVKRGGNEWLVSDEGAGVWMTLECIRALLRDIEARGADNYHSVLLDRLSDFLGIPYDATEHIPESHRAMARIELIARRVSENRPDTKRYLASFVYPHIFDLATIGTGHYDPLAATVLNESVNQIAENTRYVSDLLAAYTADAPNLRERIPMVVGGNIAANPVYRDLLTGAISSSCRFISSIDTIGDAAHRFAGLASDYLKAGPREKAQIRRAFDPLHPIEQLL